MLMVVLLGILVLRLMILLIDCTKMAERLCLQWNDFRDNVTSAFGNLREDKDFSDVTLAYED